LKAFAGVCRGGDVDSSLVVSGWVGRDLAVGCCEFVAVDVGITVGGWFVNHLILPAYYFERLTDRIDRLETVFDS
jgi:hypothetical protein